MRKKVILDNKLDGKRLSEQFLEPSSVKVFQRITWIHLPQTTGSIPAQYLSRFLNTNDTGELRINLTEGMRTLQ